MKEPETFKNVFIFFIILFLSQIQYSVILQLCVIWKFPSRHLHVTNRSTRTKLWNLFKVKQNVNRTTSMAKREEKVVVHKIYGAIVKGQIILEAL